VWFVIEPAQIGGLADVVDDHDSSVRGYRGCRVLAGVPSGPRRRDDRRRPGDPRARGWPRPATASCTRE
jgi:hypothetical protein